MRTVIVIPARYASTRLPGKPLVDIGGKPMIRHVYERCLEVPGVAEVLVATDDERIRAAVSGFGGRAVMTSPDHPSGTDRIVEAMAGIAADLVVNVQGDEPLVEPADLATLIAGMAADPAVDAGTLCHPVAAAEAGDPNLVKVVVAANGDALYFSRSPIPYPRDGEHPPRYLRHVGIYGYRRHVLERYAALPVPPIETIEKLEQLRLLHAGYRMRVFEIAGSAPGVDTPESLALVRALMRGEAGPAAASLETRLAGIGLVICDVDGVLTDGTLHYTAEGEAAKSFHVRDGLGIKRLEKEGVAFAILSGRDSAALRRRIDELGITRYRVGCDEKGAGCRELMAEAGIAAAQTAVVGDDVNDLPAFAACGLAVTVADGAAEARAAADLVVLADGGRGAIRLLADAILAARRGPVTSLAALGLEPGGKAQA